VGMVVTLLAMRSYSYRVLSQQYRTPVADGLLLEAEA
jgi:hypothetical protein